MLSESARASQAKEVERLQIDLQRASQDAQKEIQEFTQELQIQFQQKLLPVIEQVAKEKNLHFILSIADAGVVWVDAGLDVTADVVTRSTPPRRRPSRARPLWPGPGATCAGSGCLLPAAHERSVSINLPPVVDRLCSRFPQQMVDAVTELTTGERLVAIKNVTVNEDFFQGHFPGAPLMPGVLMIESMAQAASVLLLQLPTGRSCRIAPRCVAWTARSSASRSSRATACASSCRSSAAGPPWRGCGAWRTCRTRWWPRARS